MCKLPLGCDILAVEITIVIIVQIYVVTPKIDIKSVFLLQKLINRNYFSESMVLFHSV